MPPNVLLHWQSRPAFQFSTGRERREDVVMENVQKTLTRILHDVASIPTDERVRQVEHAIGLAVAAYGTYSVLCALGWAATRPGEAKDYVIESIVEMAKVLPPVRAYLDNEESNNLEPIKKKMHGDGDPGETVCLTALASGSYAAKRTLGPQRDRFGACEQSAPPESAPSMLPDACQQCPHLPRLCEASIELLARPALDDESTQMR